MPIRVEEVSENLFDEEIHLCLPRKDSPQYSGFRSGIEKKQLWLKKRLKEMGSVAQIALYKGRPVAFIEYVHAKNAPIPIDEDKNTALITCIHKPKSQVKGVGTALIQAALKRLEQLGMECVKTLVGRHPQWITGSIYFKNGFELEKTFYKPGGAEPLDLLTLNLRNKQAQAKEPTTISFPPLVSDAMPIGIVNFSSGQCPFNAVVQTELLKALETIDRKQFVLEILDSWENCKLARECGAMYADLSINGRAPFMGPASQEKIRAEILKEINRIKGLEQTSGLQLYSAT